MKSKIDLIDSKEVDVLYNDIKKLVEESRNRVYKTIGILLSTDKNETIVKYTLPEDNNTIFSAEFKLTIPSKQEFINVIEDEKRNLELL